MNFFYKFSAYLSLYKLLSVRLTHHPFFKLKLKRHRLSSLLLLGFRRERIVFSSYGLLAYFLKIKNFFTKTPQKSFIAVSTNELQYFLSKGVFKNKKVSCIFAPRLGFLTNTSNFRSINRITENNIVFNPSFVLYLGHGGLQNILKESLVLNIPVFAVTGSEKLIADIDYPLLGDPTSIRTAYFYCSFISLLHRFFI